MSAEFNLSFGAAAEMRQPTLEGAQFHRQAINEQQAKQLISAGQALLNQASACAANPGTCGL